MTVLLSKMAIHFKWTRYRYTSLSNYMDEEEQFADQMKEYLFFAESLR